MIQKKISSKIRSQSSCLIVLIGFSLILYFNALKAEFQFDDRFLLKQHYISDLSEFRKKVNFFADDAGNYFFRVVANRPVLLLTFAINNHLNAKRPFGFHLFNVLIHISVSILVFFNLILAVRVLNLSFLSNTGEQTDVIERTGSFQSFSLLVALLFAIHPLVTDSVTYISSRSSILMSFFYLLCIYGYLQFLLAFSLKNLWNRIFWGASIFFFFYCAISSKLTAATLPLVLGVFYFLIFKSFNLKHIPELFNSKIRRWVFGFLLFSPFIFVVNYVELDQGFEIYGRWPYFLVQFKVFFFYYMKMFLWPVNQNIDIGFPISFFGSDFRILFSIVSLFLLTVWVFSKNSPLLHLALLWVALTLAPTSSLVPLNDLAVEHRLYLPMSLGLCLLMVLWIVSLKWKRRLVLIVLMVLSWGLLTTSRNRVWIDEMTLWQDAAAKNTMSARPLANIGKAYYERDDRETALEFLEKSVSLSESIPDTHYNLGNVYMDFNRLEESEKAYKKAISLKRRYEAAWLGLGSVYSQKGNFPEAIDSYREAITIHKIHTQGEDYAMARLNLGEVYGKMGQYDKAVKELKIALRWNPGMYKAYYNLGTAFIKLGHMEEGEQAFLNCLKIKPDFEKALFNTAYLYQLKKNYSESNRYFKDFLKIRKNDAKALFSLGVNALGLRDQNNAAHYFKQTLSNDPRHLGAHINLGQLGVQRKEFDIAVLHFLKALAIQPNQFQLHVQIGLILDQHLNRKTEATEHLRKAMELSPDPGVKNQIAKILTSIKRS